ncbi:MAG TPA: efflux RND transporter periplasmic adaptor subunit [Chitinophagaceae bacterium]|nr:efflux RND transporter periplasmic adaptor subunit [Chitinophagaceae bacterium]
MKRKSLIFIPLILLGACKPKSKQDQLKALQLQEKEISAKIDSLQLSIGPVKDSSKVNYVVVRTLGDTDFRNYIQILGQVDALEDVNVMPEAQGVVTGVYGKLGQRVTQGQLLAKLDDQVIRQGLAQLQNQLAYFQNLYDRQKNLWAENIGTKVQLLTAKNNVENIKQQIAVQQSQEDMYLVKAPVSGTLDHFDVRLGEAITPTSIRIVNTREMKVKGSVGETFADKVHTGDPVTVIFPDAADTLNTRLSYVGKIIDPSSRSFDIEIQLEGKEKQFKPNMVAMVKIVSYENKKAIVIPINPVQITPDGDFVLIADGGVAKKVKVALGQTYNGQTEVIRGLSPGDKLIVTGYQDLENGDRVSY